jgi:hypothetical protein
MQPSSPPQPPPEPSSSSSERPPIFSSRPPPSVRRRRRRAFWPVATALVLLLAVPVLMGTAIVDGITSKRAAHAFVLAVRGKRFADARALASDRLAPYLADEPPQDGPAARTDEARALDLVRRSTAETYGGFSGGSGDACLDVTLVVDGHDKGVEMYLSRDSGEWQVKSFQLGLGCTVD